MQLHDWYPEAPEWQQVNERAFYCLAPVRVEFYTFQRGDQIYCLDRGNEVYPSDWKFYRKGDKVTVDSLWGYTHCGRGIEEGAWADLCLDNSADLALLAHAIMSLKMDYYYVLELYREEELVYDTIHRGYLHLEKINENTFRTALGKTVMIKSIGYGYAKDEWELV